MTLAFLILELFCLRLRVACALEFLISFSSFYISILLFMSVYSRNTDRVYEPLLKIGERRVQSVSKYEYLGIIMDDRLNMDSHIEHITKKVQAKLSILRKIRRHISEESALLIFKTMILCHFDYGDFVVDSGTTKKTGNLD